MKKQQRNDCKFTRKLKERKANNYLNLKMINVKWHFRDEKVFRRRGIRFVITQQNVALWDFLITLIKYSFPKLFMVPSCVWSILNPYTRKMCFICFLIDFHAIFFVLFLVPRITKRKNQFNDGFRRKKEGSLNFTSYKRNMMSFERLYLWNCNKVTTIVHLSNYDDY